MEPVKYRDDALVITIPTHCPAATHHLLMTGLIASLKQNLTAEKQEKDMDGLVVVAEMLQLLIPKEQRLIAAFE